MAERTALYAGSFDPYTNGHHDIVKKAARLFDRVDVVIGVNVLKARRFDPEAMRSAMQALYDAEGLRNVRAVCFDGLMVDYCAAHGIGYYVRGLRSAADYASEENTACVNAMLDPTLETVYLRSNAPALSSSVVRELLAFGRDVGAYVPAPVNALIREE
ncbi:MAG: pantetheine-phosphate adenylyltransferase [Clostridia bacterium]|nr:pantetheine-phosphate adenylyltransferase [Clostridia bacterium]